MKHNPERILEIAKKFKDRNEVKVVVVSEGPGATYLKKSAEQLNLENMVFLPFQEFSVLPQVLASSDVLIVLLEPDAGVFSVPSKILSYLCSQRPILGSIPEENLAGKIINQNKVGFRVNPDDGQKFIEKAEILLDLDRDLLQEFGRNGRHYAEENFNITDIGNKFEDFFNRL